MPREITLKRILVHDKKSLLKHFNDACKHEAKGAHASVYSFPKLSGQKKVKRDEYTKHASIDKAYMDIDLEDYNFDPFCCYIAMVTAHLLFESIGVQHSVNFTGNGYHVFFGVDALFVPDDDKDLYLKELLRLLKNVTGLKLCSGNFRRPTARMCRMVGSPGSSTEKKEEGTPEFKSKKRIEQWKRRSEGTNRYVRWLEDNGFKTLRFCYSLSHEDIHGGHFNIYHKSLTRSTSIRIFCRGKIILSSIYAGARKIQDSFKFTDEDFGVTINDIADRDCIDGPLSYLEKLGIKRKEVPECIRCLMLEKNAGYMERFFLVLYFCELSLTKKEIKDMLSMILSKEKFYHAYVEEYDQPDYVHDCYSEIDSGYGVNCGSMRSIGFCSPFCQKKSVF